MQNFDPRKQKRLGPAPIASFEKSFEDNTQTQQGTSSVINPLIALHNCQIPRQLMDSASDLCEDPPPLQSLDSFSSNSPNKSLKTSEAPAKATTPIRTFLKDGKKPPLLHTKESIQDIPPLRAPLQSLAPLTPRIDISRASSSSQHEDSRESSPENVFEQVGTGTLQEAISLGFREEGALDLRTSTEELYFMDPQQKKEEQEKLQQEKLQQEKLQQEKLQHTRKSPVIFKYDDQQLYLQQHQRKDSASSEVAALLCISGRTSRVSSVGSQGSAVSHLSAISAVSGVSRSPSPHRMLMETSFCGPKPLENVVESCGAHSSGQQTAEILENVLLSRTTDLTQVILAEGIKLECSPQKKKIINNDNIKKKLPAFDEISKIEEEKITNPKKILSHPLIQKKGAIGRRDSTKIIVGVTPTGTEYIRINLKPDYLYPDQGVAPNEKIIEDANNANDKPSTLKLNNDAEKPRLHLSPKQTRHAGQTKDVKPNIESRSPSPANPGSSRKSSFCSLFKPKESPDSPRDRSRSKSNERGSVHSQTVTPNKQKSVLAIFKPKRSGSKSKSASPIDHDGMSNLDEISQVEFKFNIENQSSSNQEIVRPTSRLRYYDTPPDGKTIYIPLHTPPEEKDVKQILPGITQEALIKQKGQLRSMTISANKPIQSKIVLPETNITETYSEKTVPEVETKIVETVIETIEQKPLPPVNTKPLKTKQFENVKKIENLDSVHNLPDDANPTQRTWSLEVHHHSSQESQETVASESSINSVRRISKPNLDNVIESPVKENGTIEKEIKIQSPTIVSSKQITTKVTVQQPQRQQQIFKDPKGQHANLNSQANGDAISKEKKRILFATRLGSGSQEQIFSTQFSLSKTESLSSQLSEQNSIPESPAELKDSLHRSDTVLRRPDDLKKKDSIEDFKRDLMYKSSSFKKELEETVKSFKNSEEKRQNVSMRKKEAAAEFRKRTEEESCRHSKYFENLDITKSIGPESKIEIDIHQTIDEKPGELPPVHKVEKDLVQEIAQPPSPAPHIPLPPPPPPTGSDHQSVTSTDEPIEDTSESERDTETDPNCLKKHIPRHLGIIEDHESTGLVSQTSFEDELPYVPTTLPEERTQGVSIIPVKERAHMEMKTLSLDRPRSTTPMNPVHLEEFCEIVTPESEVHHGLVRGEKLRISLPRKDSTIKDKPQKAKSPRRVSNSSGKSWFEFAEQGIRGASTTTTSTTISHTITTPKDTTQKQFPTKQHHNNCESTKSHKNDKVPSSPPPPLPPRKPSTTSIASGQWINFENIPEKRKPPKRITALPKEAMDMSNKTGTVQYNYVKPEECQCECHDSERDPSHHASDLTETKGNSISSVDLLKHSSGEDLQPLLDATDMHDGVYRSDSSQDDYGIEEHQHLKRQRNGKQSANSKRSSDYSDCNESEDQHTNSSRPSKNSS